VDPVAAVAIDREHVQVAVDEAGPGSREPFTDIAGDWVDAVPG
jgi:hypothetical protein